MRCAPIELCNILSRWTVSLALVLVLLSFPTAFAQSPSPQAADGSNEALARRLDELERTTRELRWAGGAQYALDSNFPVITGSLNNGYFRTRNWQSEGSVWWTPGPFSFALAYNFTRTDFRKVDPLTLAGVDLKNDNTKIEFIGWFSF